MHLLVCRLLIRSVKWQNNHKKKRAFVCGLNMASVIKLLLWNLVWAFYSFLNPAFKHKAPLYLQYENHTRRRFVVPDWACSHFCVGLIGISRTLLSVLLHLSEFISFLALHTDVFEHSFTQFFYHNGVLCCIQDMRWERTEGSGGSCKSTELVVQGLKNTVHWQYTASILCHLLPWLLEFGGHEMSLFVWFSGTSASWGNVLYIWALGKVKASWS